jgi:rhodanese-related sulfurtransferase
MKKIEIIFLLFLFGQLFSCSAQNNKDEITIEQLVQKMKTDSSTVILDVRTESELNGPLSRIEGIIHIPLQELHKRLDELSELKGKDINVICHSGRRSKVAASILNTKNFKAKNVIGGMAEYRKKGY